MALLKRLDGWLWALARMSTGALMISATALVFANVVLRYIFNYALSWGDEVITYGLLWLIFLGSGIAARLGAHVSMEVLLTLLSRRAQRYNAVMVNVTCGVLSAIVGWLGWRLAAAVGEVGQVGAASGLPMFWVYLAIPAGCILMVIGFWQAALGRLRGEAPPPDAAAGKNLAAPG
jgi:C4-dicarboxylate transporter, DctQ subunit